MVDQDELQNATISPIDVGEFSEFDRITMEFKKMRQKQAKLREQLASKYQQIEDIKQDQTTA